MGLVFALILILAFAAALYYDLMRGYEGQPLFTMPKTGATPVKVTPTPPPKVD